jgi:hypothetical protein
MMVQFINSFLQGGASGEYPFAAAFSKHAVAFE